jgi:hypothetical protein
MVTTNQIEKAVETAWIMAENWDEGSIIIQLYKTNRSLLVTHQMGNSWASMGLNANESENRILYTLDCRDFEPQYWEGEEEIPKNRLDPQDYDDVFYSIVDEVRNEIEGIKVRGNI